MSLNVGETKGHVVKTCSEDAFFRRECQFSKAAFAIDSESSIKGNPIVKYLQRSIFLQTGFLGILLAHVLISAYGKLHWAI